MTPKQRQPYNTGQLRIRSLHVLLAMMGLSGLTSGAPLWAGELRPALMLPNVYHPGVVLPDYWISEKYDGVRGYWDGQKLLTRGGQTINAPAWFTAGWPTTPLDGELWAGRGQFSLAVSTIKQHIPNDAAWREMRFMVFDLPGEIGPFNERLTKLNNLLAKLMLPWVEPVAQNKIASQSALQSLLLQTVKHGGEGLMLHRAASAYKAQRNDDLLKLKTHEDAEARVIAHVPGKGKYAGQLGALWVEMPSTDGKPALRFKLGTGLTDSQRLNPPAIGMLITYRYRGLNDSGIPRFASFMRSHDDLI